MAVTVLKKFLQDLFLFIRNNCNIFTFFYMDNTWHTFWEFKMGYGFKVADLNFGCATFCALPSFGAVTKFSSHTTFFSHKVSVKGSDIYMCSAI